MMAVLTAVVWTLITSFTGAAMVVSPIVGLALFGLVATGIFLTSLVKECDCEHPWWLSLVWPVYFIGAWSLVFEPED